MTLTGCLQAHSCMFHLTRRTCQASALHRAASGRVRCCMYTSASASSVIDHSTCSLPARQENVARAGPLPRATRRRTARCQAGPTGSVIEEGGCGVLWRRRPHRCWRAADDESKVAQSHSLTQMHRLVAAIRLTRDEKRDQAYRAGAVYLRTLGIDSQTELTRVRPLHFTRGLWSCTSMPDAAGSWSEVCSASP